MHTSKVIFINVFVNIFTRVEELFPINYFLKISFDAQINVCSQLCFKYFSTFHTQYKEQDQFRTMNLCKNAQNGRSFDLSISERKKGNVDKTLQTVSCSFYILKKIFTNTIICFPKYF